MTMKIEWKMSIGYPTAQRAGTIEIEDQEVEGKTDGEIESYIDERVFDDALQYVDTTWSVVD